MSMARRQAEAGWCGAALALAFVAAATGCSNRRHDPAGGAVNTAAQPPTAEPVVLGAGDLALTATLDPGSTPRRVGVNITVENRGRRDLLVLDRLWEYDARGKHADPEQAYRFVGGSSLRLLFGPAPYPPNMSVNDGQFPDGTRLGPGEKLSLRVEQNTPVREYNPFFEPKPDTTYRTVHVDKIDVIVQYVVAEAERTRPSRLGPKAVELAAWPGTMRAVHVRIATPPFEALRRADLFQRVRLPGEQEP
jgi:hypothetical protein